MLPGSVPQAGAQTSVSDDIEKPVKQAIDTRQATQAAQEKWDGERSKLIAQYDRLKARNEQLTAVRDRLSTRADKLTAANRALEAEKAEAERIATEMHPHLSSVTDRINALIRTDAPFLHQERITRMTKLAAIVEDPEITVAEKYRKTMEALFIEAEYGNTVEVYQEKIRLDDSEVLGNIFRLGRVSLFFLSLDQANAAVFDVASEHWVGLGSDAVQAIAAVNAMAAKHRPMEVVSLPVGRLAPAKGGDHDEE
ncbi:MAG: DUF3450 domain-containing protein [Desulfobacterales bacterium]|nr:DUF3450 domain-containing protein [Desulfobacterales bacterium]